MVEKINSVEFDEDTHTYAVNGEIANLSVTELLAKQNLAPDYSSVNKVLLKDSADYGTMIHKDLENVANGSDATTPQGENFANWLIKQDVDETYAEFKMGLIWGNLVLGGTADLICRKGDETWVADHKTTTTIHTKAVTWQVNLLDYMAQYNLPNYTRAKRFYCLHYAKDESGTLDVVELEKIPDSEIEKLLDSESQGLAYNEPTLDIVSGALKQQIENAEQFLAVKEQEYKQAKKTAEDLRAKLCELFEETNTKQWISPNEIVRATYVEPTARKTVDTEKLKTDYPQVYEDCLKTSKTKGYVKVQIKQ